ncbi:MAG: two-component system sensor histidine kinase NtrB, partial [Thermodesulfobacteriota bacterium]
VCLAVLTLSILYLYFEKKPSYYLILAYFQFVVDTIVVTVIIMVTGSYESVFTFLYLIVIICSCMFVNIKGSFIMAVLISFEYTMVLLIDYYDVINTYTDFGVVAVYGWNNFIFKIIMVVGACFVIAALSAVLDRRARQARRELQVTTRHLRRVERMAAVNELLSGIAHEIKNPLASLSGAVQLLKENADTDSYDYRLMNIVLREIQRLHNLVNDFHVFTKPNISNAADLRLDNTILEIVELFKQSPETADNITINTRLDENVCFRIDGVHFQQIIWNLLKNASESIAEKGEIHIRLERHKNERVLIRIEDTGCGIEDNRVDSVFDPFYTTKAEGTGLGLAIVHRLVDSYNGVIDFHSAPGKGTVFTIIFNIYESS